MSTENEKNISEKIPASKVERATRFVKTGVKVGANYLKHYAKKAVTGEGTQEDLDKANAEDIFEGLSELKGSALKMAQMLSMQEGVMPSAYTQKFQESQYKVPPLSAPLVAKVFRSQFDKNPHEIFDTFSKDAVHAASIGQVHRASIGDKIFAVKIQYPGVAESIKSDLRMVKPFAAQIIGLNENDLERYMEEVEEMLISETDYTLELEKSVRLSERSKVIPNVFFPKYYPEYSSQRILTMEWLDGMHLDEFLATSPSQAVRNQIGQALWDFYDFQMHELLEVHADPHPGNFLFRPDGTVGILDFGCVKVIPEDYHKRHFRVMEKGFLDDEQLITQVFFDLEFLTEKDSPEERELFRGVFKRLIELTTLPLQTPTFDFGDKGYFDALFEFGEEMSKMPELRNSKQARGSRHSLYLNRTYFGLYFMLNRLGANISTYSRFRG
jgi:predicted unusual protein kinase regulating ubiquinone biosynthesis (AarF/ABC1/UbiB family)